LLMVTVLPLRYLDCDIGNLSFSCSQRYW
jgi:hypothetical protein